MSLSELERLVIEAEAEPSLQRTLRRCRSRQQLIHTARRLGYRITQSDLQRAWQQERHDLPTGGDQPAAVVIGAGI
ncbi:MULTISPECIES: Nif11-like leader peptide family natural product precursor [unclassified Cyanobium]|uniref:Nif11-like leader peptide family natural product precursor n=1 Tax=unclassified Cyanobium TaxID=2627006 RepID=UPI0020CB7397|nr:MULTISPECIES: Nif11-like leader peptide family natural product precursor [unclassified Cyanobium]MCP9861376.1 Nif11-like leader peptide family natural product precursor [Cyanobium sp. Cruz-8H5]MCP9868612.1 Nif11-like leader peptide family natural product precursor [Cyanobium sp. Cruz-8D1]